MTFALSLTAYRLLPSALSRAGRARRRVCAQARFDGGPIYVGEEGFDVLGSFGRFVVQEECVLPHVHHKYRLKARNVAGLVQADPMVRDAPVGRILVADGPTDPAHLADRHKIGLPNIV